MCLLKRGLCFIILFFFVGNLFSQNNFKKTITSKSPDIYIELDLIQSIEIIVNVNRDEIVVLRGNENKFSIIRILDEKDGIVFIWNKKNYWDYKYNDMDKLCTIQPDYTSFKGNHKLEFEYHCKKLKKAI